MLSITISLVINCLIDLDNVRMQGIILQLIGMTVCSN